MEGPTSELDGDDLIRYGNEAPPFEEDHFAEDSDSEEEV